MLYLFVLLFLGVQAEASEWKLNANGDLKVDALYYPQTLVGTQSHEERFNLRAPMSARWKKNWRLRFQPMAQASPGNRSTNEQSFLEFPEAYLQWQNSPFTIQAGLNTLAWGSTDVFNPLDVVNQRIYYDPLRSEKRGAPMILARWENSPLQIEALYIPVQRRTLLPGTHSRWLPRDIYRTKSFGTSFGPARITLPEDVQYSYNKVDKELDRALKNNFGFRLTGNFTGVDLTLMGFEGAASTPVVGISGATLNVTSLSPELVATADPPIELQATYYRQRTFGTSGVVVLGDFLVKGAAANTTLISKRSDLPKYANEYVLGVERSVPAFGDSITFLLQGTHTKQDIGTDTSTTSLSRMFEKAVMLGVRYAPERWSVLLSGLADLKYEGNLAHIEIGHKLSDPCELKLSGDILGGKKETPIGTYRRNDRVIAGLAYHL